MKRIPRAVLLCATAAITYHLPVSAQDASTQGTPKQIYVFGDSSVEQGNLYLTPGFDRTGSPYFDRDGFSRDSNGPVWIEYLAPDIRPYLKSIASANRVNFAYSGATSGTGNLVGLSGTGLLGQIDLFAARIASGSPRPGAGSVAVIAAGVNDFIRDLGEVDLRVTSSQVTANLTASARRLSALGVSRILVEDAPNFIVAPEFAGIVPPGDRPALVKIIGDFVEGHNAALIQELRKTNAELASTDIVTVRVSKLFDHVRANAAALGFKVTDRACYDETSGTLCSRDPATQNEYLFFDNLHLTTRAQAIQADYYSALLGQLSGSAHTAPARLVRDVAETMRLEADNERANRRSAWLGDAVPSGLAMIGDLGVRQVRDSGRLAARGDRTAFRVGLGVGDGSAWSARIVAAKQDSDLTTATGSAKLDGWSVTTAGERRWGDFRLGASATYYSAAADGTRRIPVALMKTDWSAGASGTSAELEAGYRYGKGDLLVMPSVWGRYERARVTGFAETGDTGLEMAYSNRNFEAVYAGIGATAAYRLSPSFVPRLTASYERRVTPADHVLTGELIDNSADPISAKVQPFRRQVASVEPGIDVALGPVALSLNGSARLDRAEYGASARMTLAF